jgi:hypothetical protein
MKNLLSFIILFFFFSPLNAQQIARPADDILGDAFQQAAAQHKNVLVIFHTSWCGWCHKMDASINDSTCKNLFDKNYIIVHLTVEESDDNKPLENPGAVDVLVKCKAENAGLPYWLILSNQGQFLADSKIRAIGAPMESGDNMGCPSTETQVAAFIKILKQSSTLTDDELAVIAKRFRENAN